MSTISLQVAPRVGPINPRGARAAAALFMALSRLIGTAFGRLLPRARSAAEEARDVRDMALQYEQVYPDFAADLRAAADRHERLDG